jgi:hypothetical protein
VAKESASKILSIDGLFLSISYPVDSDSFKGWIQRFSAFLLLPDSKLRYGQGMQR